VARVCSMPTVWSASGEALQALGAQDSGISEAVHDDSDAGDEYLRHTNSSSEALYEDKQYAWFYPDPPWGRKDVFRPGSKFLQMWDCVLWLAMLYVGFHVPFHAAGFVANNYVEEERCDLDWTALWKGPEHKFDLFVDSIFWCDMVFSMHTALYRRADNGVRVLVEEVKEIRQHYLRSRNFVYDLCGVLPLRMSACVLTKLMPASMRPPHARFVNIIRLFRMAKLFRLHHLNRITNFIKYTFPRKTRTVLDLATLLLKMLFTGHLLACLWYYIGISDPVGGWVAKKIPPQEPTYSRYISSFYFVYATITTVGYGDVAGLNSAERLFSVGAMVLGGFLFGLLIGSVPKILDRRSEAGGRYLEVERRLKQYLKDKQVPALLHARILQFFEYRYPERRSFDGHKIISDLPLSLQKDLAAHVYRAVISASPLLRRCSPKTTGELCLLLRRVFAAEGDVISREGTQSTGLYFIVCGQVALSQGWECKQILGEARGSASTSWVRQEGVQAHLG
jgi:hypothetical protein